MNDQHYTPEMEAKELQDARDAVTEQSFTGDDYTEINKEREGAALEEFNGTVKLIQEICSVGRIEAIRRMIKAEEMDPSDRIDVEKFLWQSGLNVDLITAIRSELVYSDPELKLEK